MSIKYGVYLKPCPICKTLHTAKKAQTYKDVCNLYFKQEDPAVANNTTLKYPGYFKLQEDPKESLYLVADRNYQYRDTLKVNNFHGCFIRECQYDKTFDYNILMVAVKKRNETKFLEIAKELDRRLAYLFDNYQDFKEFMSKTLEGYETKEVK